MQRRELAATLTAQAVPALHVGALWQGIHEKEIGLKQSSNGGENQSSLPKMNIKGNKLNSKDEITIKNLSKVSARGNDSDISKNANSLLEGRDIGMMKRCQRKMSQTLSSSLHLTVPNSTSLKVSDVKYLK